MEKEKLLVDKPKWKIKAVPWSISETGLMVNVPVWIEITSEDTEFVPDLVGAILSRYDLVFPGDIKPKRTREEVIAEFNRILETAKASYEERGK